MAPHPNVRIPDPWGYEFYSFGTGFLVYPNHVLSLSAKISITIEEDLKNFYLFYDQENFFMKKLSLKLDPRQSTTDENE